MVPKSISDPDLLGLKKTRRNWFWKWKTNGSTKTRTTVQILNTHRYTLLTRNIEALIALEPLKHDFRQNFSFIKLNVVDICVCSMILSFVQCF